MLPEKAKCELHKDTAFCFQQILFAATYKTAAVQPFPTHLSNIQEMWTKYGEQCWEK